MTDTDDKDIKCDFCESTKNQVKKLIDSQKGVYICNECVDICYQAVHHDDKKENTQKVEEGKIPSPKQIKEFLDQYVIGQDTAKLVISVAVSNHYKRLANPTINDVEIEKSNIIMFGPSGSGKTILCKRLAEYLDVPFTIADATSLTEAGYVGEDVESIIARLYQVSNYDIKKTQRGIIYIDEVDKKARKSEGNSSITRDVSGEGVQQSLLKMIEGDVVNVPPQGGRKHPNQDTVKVDTTNILFIVGGAFVGLDKIVDKDKSNSSSIGFGSELQKVTKNTHGLLKEVQPEHLIKYGLIPEFVGRLPVIAALEELDEHQLVQILTEPKNALIKQFQSLFSLEDVELEFTQESLVAIAKKAKEKKTGARGLRSILENLLIETQYNLADYRREGVSKILINLDVIEEKTTPIKIYEETKNAS